MALDLSSANLYMAGYMSGYILVNRPILYLFLITSMAGQMDLFISKYTNLITNFRPETSLMRQDLLCQNHSGKRQFPMSGHF